MIYSCKNLFMLSLCSWEGKVHTKNLFHVSFMFKAGNYSCQESVHVNNHALFYVQGGEKFIIRTRSCLIYVQGMKLFMPRICFMFHLCSCFIYVEGKKPFMPKKSVSCFIYIEGRKPFMPRIYSCFIHVKAGNTFMPVHVSFMFKAGNRSCQQSVQQRKPFMLFLCSRKGKVDIRIHSCLIYVQDMKTFMLVFYVQGRKRFHANNPFNKGNRSCYFYV
jgi:hypothetical protein